MTAAADLEPRFLTLKQAAKVTGLSADTLERYIHSGDLKAKRSGKKKVDGQWVATGKFVVRVADLDAWFEGLMDA